MKQKKNKEDKGDKVVFAFYSHKDGRCECVIDGEVYTCSSFRQAVDIFNKILLLKGEIE